MKVGFHTHPFAMDVPGGGEVQLLEYVRLLRGRGIEVWLHDTWKPQFLSLDLFHHFHLLSGSLPMLDYMRRLGLPVLISTNIWFDQTNMAGVNIAEIVRYLEIANRFIANSQAEIANIADHIGCDVSHGRVVHNGVSDHFAQQIDTRAFSDLLPFEGRYILNVANIEPRKNQLALAEAARRLDVPVVVLGGVRNEQYLRACQNAYEGFYHLGPQHHDGAVLHAAFQHAEVFALPSTFETPGLAALEAAVAGCKLVVTKGGCTREYFGDLAVYVDPASPDDIATGLETAFSAKGRAEDLQQHVLGNYRWESVATSLLSHYLELLGQGELERAERH